MFIKVNDVIGEGIRYINVNHITAIQRIRTDETLVEYINGCCYTDLNPSDLVLEIERIKNEENE